MKLRIFNAVLLLCVLGAITFKTATVVSAQTASNGVIMLLQAGAPSGCAWPPGATVTNGMALCATSSGLYYALNGGAFAPVAGGQAAAPVTSVFGRTGPVVAATGDYSYSQLSAPPTTLSCSTASISTGTSGSLSASGCTIK